jgi:hypothetical protein
VVAGFYESAVHDTVKTRRAATELVVKKLILMDRPALAWTDETSRSMKSLTMNLL